MRVMGLELDLLCCRVCLANDFSGQSILDSQSKTFLPDVIRNLTGIDVTEDNGLLPSTICFNCASSLVDVENLRKKIIESNEVLKSKLSLAKKPEIVVDSPMEDSGIVWNDIINEHEDNFGNYEQIDDIKQILDRYLETTDGKNEIEVNSCRQEDEMVSVEGEQSEKGELEQHAFNCNLCSKSFSVESTYRRHLKYHSQEKTKCPICTKEFSHKSNLKRHLSVHKDKNELICDKCGEIFTESKDLYLHMKIHIKTQSDEDKDEYVLDCGCCGYKTTSLAQHLTHMKTHNVDVLKPFKCRICDMKFASKQGMYRHIDNIHENNRRNLRNRDKNFLCNDCGKKFFTNFHLLVHIRSHTGERPFKCDYCDKSFSQLSGLKMHTFIHTGEKPFDCKICGKRFNQYGHVREHLLTHSDARPHVCKICNHSFRVKGNLTAHMMIHTGKKPFSCSYCEKGFTQRTKLKTHMDKCHLTAMTRLDEEFKIQN